MVFGSIEKGDDSMKNSDLTAIFDPNEGTVIINAIVILENLWDISHFFDQFTGNLMTLREIHV